MKLFNKSLIAAMAVTMAALTSCSDSDQYQPGAESAGAFFESVPSTREFSIAENSFAVTVARTVVTDAAQVPVQLTDPSGLFSGPSSVNFAAGAATAEYVISYDNTKVEQDVNYEITLTLQSDFNYGVTSYSFVANSPAPWNSLGEGLYRDGIINSLFNVGDFMWEVEIQEHSVTPGFIRVISPYYGYPVAGHNGGYSNVLYDDKGNRNMELYINNPDRVWFNPFNTGMYVTGTSVDETPLIAVSRAQFYIENGNDEEKVAQAGWFGTLEDGIITFPVQGMFVCPQGLYTDAAHANKYYGNADGTEMILMPGVVLSDYSATIDYTGFSIDKDGNKFVKAQFELGEDVESAHIAAVLTSNPQEAITAIVTGSVDIVEVSNTGKVQTVEVPVEEDGDYILGIVTYANGEPQDADYTSFELSLGGKTWEDAGVVEIIDGWAFPYLTMGGNPVNAADYPWFAEVQKNLNKPGVYRIRNMYGVCPQLSDLVYGVYNITIDMSDPEFVLMPMQPSGISDLFSFDGSSYEMPNIGNLTAFYVAKGYNKTQILAAGIPNTTLNDGVIFFEEGAPGKTFDSDSSNGFYNASKSHPNGVTAQMTLMLDDESAQALNAKKAVKKSIREIRAAKDIKAAKAPFMFKGREANGEFTNALRLK